ncbi:MAG: hypothetical protein BJ554DRAFT_1006, partial [Olpidium bornovanus]
TPTSPRFLRARPVFRSGVVVIPGTRDFLFFALFFVIATKFFFLISLVTGTGSSLDVPTERDPAGPEARRADATCPPWEKARRLLRRTPAAVAAAPAQARADNGA